MNKSISILIILIIFLALISCNSSLRKEDSRDYNYNYSVIISEDIIHDKEYRVTSKSGTLLIEFGDSLLTYYDVFEIIKEISLSENLIYASVFYSKGYPIDSLLKNFRNTELNDYFLGELDVRSKGMNWMHLIDITDMNFNNEELIKLKIRTKFN